MTTANDPLVGIQIGPISFVDEGVDQVLDTLQERAGVNALLLGTVSWLSLKIGAQHLVADRRLARPRYSRTRGRAGRIVPEVQAGVLP